MNRDAANSQRWHACSVLNYTVCQQEGEYQLKSIEVCADEVEITIAISDNGCGIPIDVIEGTGNCGG